MTYKDETLLQQGVVNTCSDKVADMLSKNAKPIDAGTYKHVKKLAIVRAMGNHYQGEEKTVNPTIVGSLNKNAYHGQTRDVDPKIIANMMTKLQEQGNAR